MATDKECEQIHAAANILKAAIEKYVGSPAIVYWAGFNNGKERSVTTGMTFSVDAKSQDIEHTVIDLVGRIYNNIDYGLND